MLRRSLLRLGFSILIGFAGSSTALAGATIEAFVTTTLVDGRPVASIGQVFRCSELTDVPTIPDDCGDAICKAERLYEHGLFHPVKWLDAEGKLAPVRQKGRTC